MFYIDTNASAKVTVFAQPSWPNANPSSQHTLGKAAKRSLKDVESFLFEFFALSSKDFHLFFHSGATEGINTVVNSFLQQKTPFLYACAGTDHSVSLSLAEWVKNRGQNSILLPVEKSGELAPNVWQSLPDSTTTLINITPVNNDTGVVIRSMPELTANRFIHLDLAQWVGRVENPTQLPQGAHYLTFSGHKFGAWKGVGFTFVRRGAPFTPLLQGGGQQEGMRSGTENLWGILSLKGALEYFQQHFDFQTLQQGRRQFEERLKELMGEDIQIAGEGAKERSSNTTKALFRNQRGVNLLSLLDAHQIYVSVGSACQSGLLQPRNHVLEAMGYSLQEQASGVRFSFDLFWKEKDFAEFFKVIFPLLKK